MSHTRHSVSCGVTREGVNTDFFYSLHFFWRNSWLFLWQFLYFLSDSEPIFSGYQTFCVFVCVCIFFWKANSEFWKSACSQNLIKRHLQKGAWWKISGVSEKSSSEGNCISCGAPNEMHVQLAFVFVIFCVPVLNLEVVVFFFWWWFCLLFFFPSSVLLSLTTASSNDCAPPKCWWSFPAKAPCPYQGFVQRKSARFLQAPWRVLVGGVPVCTFSPRKPSRTRPGPLAISSEAVSCCAMLIPTPPQGEIVLNPNTRQPVPVLLPCTRKPVSWEILEILFCFVFQFHWNLQKWNFQAKKIPKGIFQAFGYKCVHFFLLLSYTLGVDNVNVCPLTRTLPGNCHPPSGPTHLFLWGHVSFFP